MLSAGIVVQDVLVVPAAVEHIDDGYQIGIYLESNHGAISIVSYAEARPNIVAHRTAPGKHPQVFTIGDDRLGISSRGFG